MNRGLRRRVRAPERARFLIVSFVRELLGFGQHGDGFIQATGLRSQQLAQATMNFGRLRLQLDRGAQMLLRADRVAQTMGDAAGQQQAGHARRMLGQEAFAVVSRVGKLEGFDLRFD